jgi:hypothetical protein
VVRVYGPYKPGEVPKIRGIDPPGALANGSFWSNKLYLSEKDFREGSVVFEEWNKGSKIALLKVKKDTRVVFGQGLAQALSPADTFNGVAKTLPSSPDWQFSFPPDQAWLDAGNSAGDWINHLISTGKLEMVLEDIPTGWRQ